MELYEKYIDINAEWKVQISAQCFDEIVEEYRRCKAHSVYTQVGYEDEGNPIQTESAIFTFCESLAFNEVQLLLRRRKVSASASKTEITALKAMVEVLDNALNDIIESLTKSFTKYKANPVLFILSMFSVLFSICSVLCKLFIIFFHNFSVFNVFTVYIFDPFLGNNVSTCFS